MDNKTSEQAIYNPGFPKLSVTRKTNPMPVGVEPGPNDTVEYGVPTTTARTSKRRKSQSKKNNPTLTFHNSFSNIFLDKFILEAAAKARRRVGDNTDAPCYTHDEVQGFNKNKFCRAAMTGVVEGIAINAVLVLFLIVSETEPEFDVFRKPEIAWRATLLALLGIIIIGSLQYLAYSYLNAYWILGISGTFAIAGVISNFNYRCEPYSRLQPTLGNGGLEFMQLVAFYEDSFSMQVGLIRAQLFGERCELPLIRLRAITLLGELINFAFALRVLFI